MGTSADSSRQNSRHPKPSSDDFGHDALNDWLKRRALKNEASGASRTYVVRHRRHVVAYYTLATGAVHCAHATGRVRRNMPDPVPVMVLGRLAVHRNWQRKGLGRDLLADAIRRTLQAADIAGIRAFGTPSPMRPNGFTSRPGLPNRSDGFDDDPERRSEARFSRTRTPRNPASRDHGTTRFDERALQTAVRFFYGGSCPSPPTGIAGGLTPLACRLPLKEGVMGKVAGGGVINTCITKREHHDRSGRHRRDQNLSGIV